MVKNEYYCLDSKEFDFFRNKRDWFTKTIALRILIAPNTILGVTGSLASNQPRNTATSGLKKAYVPTLAAVVCRNNQL